jgi:magnesium transporter
MSIIRINLDTRTTAEITHDAPRPKGMVWLDLFKPTEDDLAWLARTYNFHPLTIEDCRNFNQRAKIEAYDDAAAGYLFLSLTTSDRANGDVHPHELEAFLGADYLVTVHREAFPALAGVREHYGATHLAGRPDFLLYLIADHMVDAYFPLLDQMEDEIDALEDEILENATRATLERIYILKRQLVLLRKISSPMRDVMNALAGTRYALIDAHTALYFRDAYDHLTRIYDLIETSRDLLGNALDAYLSVVSNRLNEVMKRLTLLTTIFMPISFLVGFGGMNFQQMPFDNPIAFGILIALLVGVPITMMLWFWRSKWM